MVASSRGAHGDALVWLALLTPALSLLLLIALCTLKRFNKDKEAKISKSSSAVNLTPVTSFNGVDPLSASPTTPSTVIPNIPGIPPPSPLRGDDLFSTKASLPRLQLPLNDINHRPPRNSFPYQMSLTPPESRSWVQQPDTPPSIIITNTDSLSFNMAHQKLAAMTTMHPLAVPSTDTVMATLLADIFITKVTRSVEIGKTATGGIIYKGVWQGVSVLLHPIVTDKMRQLRDDVIILKNLRHPNIVIFFGLHQSPGEQEINVVTEYMEHGNLKEFLKSHSPDYVYKQQMVLFQQQKELQELQQQQMEMQPQHFTISSPQFKHQIQNAARAAAEMKVQEFKAQQFLEKRSKGPVGGSDVTMTGGGGGKSRAKGRVGDSSAISRSSGGDEIGRGRWDVMDDLEVGQLERSANEGRPRSHLPHSHSQSELISPIRALPGSLSSPSLPMLSSRDLVKLARDIAAGMMQLEQKSFAHKNLSASSVLVGGNLPGNLIAKLSDFGLTRHTETVPSPRWTPPEALQTKKFTTRSDLWSYGIVLYEIFTYGKLPYDDLTDPQILPWVLEGNRLHFNSATPPIVQTIAYRCWDLNPAKRPTFDEIFDLLDNYLQSPYFS